MKIVLFALGLLLLLPLGCSKSLPPTVKISGLVKLNGKPLSEGRITLYPSDKAAGSPVSSSITDGLYSLPVVPKGSYLVAFTTGPAEEVSTGTASSDFNAPKDTKGKKDPIPEKYRKPSLPVEVSADKSDQNFELTGS
jgi:hypothetical protein